MQDVRKRVKISANVSRIRCESMLSKAAQEDHFLELF